MQGLTSTVIGTTMIHMSLLFQISVSVMSATLTLEAAGLLVGALVCAVFISRLDYNVVTFVSAWIAGSSTACAPFLWGLPGFMASLGLKGFANGFFYCGECANTALEFNGTFDVTHGVEQNVN